MMNIRGLVIRTVQVVVLSACGITMAYATTDPSDPAVNHTVTRSDVAVFVADGDNTAGTEYSASDDMVETSGQDENFLEAQVYTQRYRDPATGDEQLRVFFSVHDIDANNGDRVEFYFDQLHNHGSFGDTSLDEDKMLRIERNDCTPPSCNFNLISRDGTGAFSGSGSALPISNAQVKAIVPTAYATPGFEAGWTGEFALTPADLGWSYFPQALGFYVIVRSGNQNAVSAAHPLPTSPAAPEVSYPGAANVDAWVTEADDWGNLKMRYPIDYALVLDYSGSMTSMDGLSTNRWVRAKRAADLFVAALGLFKSNMLDDQVSVSQYSWSCSGNNSSGDTTGAVSGIGSSPGRTDIPGPPTGTDSFTSGNADNPAGNNCTPIKNGIDFALANQLDTATCLTGKKDCITILMSDGFHNMPPVDVPFDPDSDFSASDKEATQIRTVALGPDGSAGTDLLAEISTAFNGGTPYLYEGKYNQVSTFPDLLQAYIETLQTPLNINQVPAVGVTYSPGAPDKLVFIGVWDDASQASSLQINCGGCGDTQTDYVNTHIGYAAAVFDNPTAGASWQISGASGGTSPNNEFVLADMRVLAEFLVEQKPYAAGDPILLQVKLLDKGQPIAGADVSVEVARPGEGLGNYLSTVQDDCSAGTPSIPKIGDDKLFAGHGLAAFAPGGNFAGSSAGVPGSAAGTSSGDPLPGRYALAAYHFQRCGKEGLDRNNLPGTKLYDDGSHGDLVAGDGIYSLAYTDTDLEGSYTFRFFALGKTTDNLDFGRMRTLSQYVGIEPDPASTASQVQNGPVVNGLQTKLYYFLPRDGLKNYLGPGFSHKYKATTSAGQLYGSIMDLNNGYYVQAVRIARGGPEPTVTITSTDGCFKKTIGPGADGGKPPVEKLIKWLILIIIVLLLLLFWCWLRKR